MSARGDEGEERLEGASILGLLILMLATVVAVTMDAESEWFSLSDWDNERAGTVAFSGDSDFDSGLAGDLGDPGGDDLGNGGGG